MKLEVNHSVIGELAILAIAAAIAFLFRNRLVAAWAGLYRLIRVLSIFRFSLLVPVILLLLVTPYVNQMVDILLAMGDKDQATERWAFALASGFAGLTVWYCARTMLRFQFHPNRNLPPDPVYDPAVWAGFKRWMPRALGTAVPGIMTGALFYWSRSMGDGFEGVGHFAWYMLLVTVLVGAFVCIRRGAAQTLSLGWLGQATDDSRLQSFPQLNPVTRWIYWILLGANILALIFFSINADAPDFLSGVGAPAFLLLGFGLITVTGSTVVYAANHYGIPALALTAVLTSIFSLFNDNHLIRRTTNGTSYQPLAAEELEAAPKSAPLASIGLSDYFADWWTELAGIDPQSSKPIPVFVISAEGGGVRAAYWTATVLAALEDGSAGGPVPFSRHVFAISGVSGGSVGAAVFDAAVAARIRSANPVSTGYVQQVDQVLKADLLSPTLRTMLFPDLLQRFLPAASVNDRAVALERALEAAWSSARAEDDSFAQPFGSLWEREPHKVPLLFLNSAVVGTGQRAINSPLRETAVVTQSAVPADASRREVFHDALPLNYYIGDSVPLSTAAILSARFTYVSPAATVYPIAPQTRWFRVVDGGYFDNSGATTAQEIVRAIRARHRSMTGQRTMRVIVLHLANSPELTEELKQHKETESQEHLLAGELTSPVRTLINARGARGSQAIGYLRDEPADTGSDVRLLTIQPCISNIAFPFGWTISEKARTTMSDQLGCRNGSCTIDASSAVKRRLKWALEAISGNGSEGFPDEFSQPMICKTTG